MRGVKAEGQMQLAAGRHHIRGKALVIFDIARGVEQLFTFKLLKQLSGVFTQHIDQHI